MRQCGSGHSGGVACPAWGAGSDAGLPILWHVHSLTLIRLTLPSKAACEKDVDELCPNLCNKEDVQASGKERGWGGSRSIARQQSRARTRTHTHGSLPLLQTVCGGKVLRCLTDKSDEIKDEACSKEVLYFEKMEVSNFR